MKIQLYGKIMIYFMLVYVPVVFGQSDTEVENLNSQATIQRPDDVDDEIVLRLTLLRKFILANQILFASNELKKISALLYAYEPQEIKKEIQDGEIDIDNEGPIRILELTQDSYGVVMQFDSIDALEKYIQVSSDHDLQNQLIGLENRVTSSGTDLKSVGSYIIRCRECQYEIGKYPG